MPGIRKIHIASRFSADELQDLDSVIEDEVLWSQWDLDLCFFGNESKGIKAWPWEEKRVPKEEDRTQIQGCGLFGFDHYCERDWETEKPIPTKEILKVGKFDEVSQPSWW